MQSTLALHHEGPVRPAARPGARARGRILAVLGPATLVSVGYMDPGNWATDLEGGARFGYQLLWVLVASNVMALLLQTLTARLGIVGGVDLAEACRIHYTRGVRVTLWALAELGIVACDLAEILGSAIALNLLFHLPMLWGAVLTVLDVLLVFALQRRGMRSLEAIVLALVVLIGACLFGELVLVAPEARAVATGLVPRLHGGSLYVAIGILGATVMPHNLYMHSSLVKTKLASPRAKQRALRSTFVGTAVALNLAFLVNAAILVLAAAVFAKRGLDVSDLRDAYRLLAPLVGTGAASLLFAVGLLCAGQSATITGTLAGQIVMEGFLRMRVSPVVRRLLTRGLAVVPAVVVLAAFGDDGTMPLLIASQVVLSMQLPFAIVPLLRFTSSRSVMGVHASGPWVKVLGVVSAVVVVGANVALVARLVTDLRASSPLGALALGAFAVVALLFLAVVGLVPLRSPSRPPTKVASVLARRLFDRERHRAATVQR